MKQELRVKAPAGRPSTIWGPWTATVVVGLVLGAVPTLAAWDLIASGAWHCGGDATHLPPGCTYKDLEAGNFGGLAVLVLGFVYALVVALVFVLVPLARGVRLRRWLVAALLPVAELALIGVAAFGG